MSPFVPKWDLDESSAPMRHNSPTHNPNSSPATAAPLLDEITEQPWENGQLPMHGLGAPCPATRHAPERPPAATGMLESIVNRATQNPEIVDDDVLVPWSGHQTSAGRVVQVEAVTMDALVPTQANKEEEGEGAHVDPRSQSPVGGPAPRVPMMGEWSRDQVSVSGMLGRDSIHLPSSDKCQKELGGFGLASTTQREANHVEERKEETSRPFLSTKQSRAIDVHNRSERKRRDKINQKIKILQKMVPNSSKTDKASMLDEVIDYIKQLQAQVAMISRMSMQSVIMPSAMQPQLHMSNPMDHDEMGIGMGMGMGVEMAMDFNVNSMMPQNPSGLLPVMNPTDAFVPMLGWDGACVNGRESPSQATISPIDPHLTYFVSQSQVFA